MQTLKTLGDACIHAARHTHSLIVEEWINGSLPIFGYFYAHYLFSCALIMFISSQIHADDCNDFALFESAYEILRAMSGQGNLAATEFYDNLESVRNCLDKRQGSIHQPPLLGENSRSSDQHATGEPPSFADSARRLSDVELSGHTASPENTAPGNLTDEMAFSGESMEEFLAQPNVDFGPLDPSGMPISVADEVYSWPNFSLWTA